MQDWAHFAGLQSAAAEQQDPGKALSWVHFQTHLWQRFFAIQLELPAAERAAQAALAQLPAAERQAEGAGSGAASQAGTPTPMEPIAMLMPVEEAESSVVVRLPSAGDGRLGRQCSVHVCGCDMVGTDQSSRLGPEDCFACPQMQPAHVLVICLGATSALASLSWHVLGHPDWASFHAEGLILELLQEEMEEGEVPSRAAVAPSSPGATAVQPPAEGAQEAAAAAALPEQADGQPSTVAELQQQGSEEPPPLPSEAVPPEADGIAEQANLLPDSAAGSSDAASEAHRPESVSEPASGGHLGHVPADLL